MELLIDIIKDNKEYQITSIDSDLINLDYIKNGNNEKLILKTDSDIKINKVLVTIPFKYDKKDLIFVNGYQSWTDSFLYEYKDHLKDVNKLPKALLNLYAFKMYGDSYFKKYNKNVIHGYDISYVEGKNNLIIMNKNFNNNYLIINHDKKNNKIVLEADINNLLINKDNEYTLFDYYIIEDVISNLNFNNEFNINFKNKIIGYTSWYNHYQDINEKIVSNCLDHLDSRFNLFQIDDGYETFVGDWLDIDQNKFPNGLKPLVDKAHDKNLMAGIWLAPFVCEKNSKLFNEHQDYLLKDNNGEPIKCGSNWSSFYALDFNKEKVREYIKKSLEYFIDLGFDFFKLDFLYAVNVNPNSFDTRASITAKAYKFLRDVLKDKLILGCGAIISNSIGNFDYLRVGPDVSLIFDDVWFMKYMHRERISTKITLQNTIYRSFLNNKLFLNDPDVFLLRDDNISLSFEQRKALIIINSLFGSVLMTSDDIKSYDDKKKELLDFALDIFNNSKDKSYKKDGNNIIINFTLNDKKYNYIYNTKKGVFING